MENNLLQMSGNPELGKDLPPLPAKMVKVLEVKIQVGITDKEGKKNYGDKITLICQHPDRNEPIMVNRVTYRKGNIIETSALWYRIDGEGNIAFKSALGNMLNHFKCRNMLEIVGKTIETANDESGYLLIKAY